MAGTYLAKNVPRSSTFQENEGVVSKETVVLRRWGSSIQKFGFINGVDNVNWPPYRAFRISVRWPIYIINSVDKTKFLYTFQED